MVKKKVIIMGAAGRDFHNFNMVFRDNPEYRVIAFTAAQIPGIGGKLYPPELAGGLYPKGVPIQLEDELESLIYANNVDIVTLSYSDLSHQAVMEKASRVLATGADFMLIGPNATMLSSKKPVVSVCAVRTGCGKSQTSRKICDILKKLGKRVVVVRHPMPYGNLQQQAVQRFTKKEDLHAHHCTIEEREEYEPIIEKGFVLFAGIDYAKILERAEAEADIIVWDGGNNDLPFFRPDVHIVVADPLRPGHELTYYPGRVNLKIAHILLINKANVATKEDIDTVRKNCKRENPDAPVLTGDSLIFVDKSEEIAGKRVLIVEDGPTLTHGGMPYGAGVKAAEMFNAAEMVSPVSFAVGSIRETFRKYPHLLDVLPAMGYSEQQRKELQETINAVDCDLVLIATPIDLGAILQIKHPVKRVRYELECPGLKAALMRRLLPVLKAKEG